MIIRKLAALLFLIFSAVPCLAQVPGAFDTQTSFTRPANTTQYASCVGSACDAMADTTPTVGGFTFTGACRTSGGSGIITDATVLSTAAPVTTLQGEIWIFNQAVTAIADNVAFAVSDADMLNYRGKIPFTLSVDAVNNSVAHISGLNISVSCVGTANLRYLVKVMNNYTPVSGEVITMTLKGQLQN